MHVATKNYEQAHTHARDNHSNDNNKLFEALKGKLIRIIIIYNFTVCKTAQHEAHALIWNNNCDGNFELTRIIMVSERAAPGSEGGADR